ncbi:hypothetical protein FJZ31_11125 [Candidatus Poribacteria bacterium]|nr:hypothetical protein [Candidatus Poribacteria bacterium]
MYAVIAVGGTGKRVALLYLKLVNTLRPSNVRLPGSNVFVIDMEPEPNTPDGQINDELVREGVPRSHFISPVREEAMVNRVITLSEYMGFGQGDDVLPVAQTLFNRNQLNVFIIKGMNCEPTVGAAVAARRFSTITTQEAEIQNLADNLAPFDQILVVGSIIGGTGAGVTPQLVDWIHNRIPGKPIYGLLYLRWITIGEGAPDEPSDVKIAGNAKAWLNYLLEHHPDNPYRARRELFRHYVLIGAPPEMRLSEAGSNSHHPLHLLGAVYLLRFDQYVQTATGATGPHYLELSGGFRPSDIQMGNDTMERAVIREKLLAAILNEFQEQQPDEALSSFTLFMREKLAWRPFIDTLERIAAKWGRRKHVSQDWRAICKVFDSERRNAENRIEELKKLTSTMEGTSVIFDFNWNHLLEQSDAKLADARAMVKRDLKEVPVAFPGHSEALTGVANRFIEQLRTILRSL